VRGWLGIQRCLDRNDYGIDILRNGRKIEVGNKDLFKWLDESSDTEEIEYPIDDPRDRGRMVGEIHLDHCRVPYTKDRFVREDAAWREMVEIVRGNTPLRPDIAERMGAGENNSPLYRLFQAFRRSNPHNRRAGGWSRILVVPDNDRAQAMAKRFDAGESEYQTDQKWWELIEDAEANVLQGGTTLTTTTQSLGGYPDGNPGDILGGEPEGGSIPPSTEQNTPRYMAPSPIRTRISSLSRQYTDDLTGQRYEIEALVVGGNDPVLTGLRCPWTIRRTTAGPWEFYVDTSSAAFRSMTLTPLDALLMQLAWLSGISNVVRVHVGHSAQLLPVSGRNTRPLLCSIPKIWFRRLLHSLLISPGVSFVGYPWRTRALSLMGFLHHAKKASALQWHHAVLRIRAEPSTTEDSCSTPLPV
jgi:hypothetical protein